MSNPFPGMDPYLEGTFWNVVQRNLIDELARQLVTKLPERYVVLTQERSAPPLPFIDIRDLDFDITDTVIEVLSPVDKAGKGLTAYRHRRDSLRFSTTHLVEIDLLRSGERFPLPKRSSKLLPPAPYFVFLNRAKPILRDRIEVWPIPLEASLPVIPVPLLGDAPDVPLDIQLAFQAIYRLFKYDRAVDHSDIPLGPLSPEQALWVEERLRLSGLR